MDVMRPWGLRPHVSRSTPEETSDAAARNAELACETKAFGTKVRRGIAILSDPSVCKVGHVENSKGSNGKMELGYSEGTGDPVRGPE